jgi:glycosyltransferase involved in cell wall biosynthesis
MHILILTDRDWGHPEAGGTGVHLTGQVDHWLEWGHSVTVIAGGYSTAPQREQRGNLTVYRFGSRVSVFPITLLRGLVDRIPKADVTLEIINGICWMTPLWLKGPRVSLIHHVHKDMYVEEMGRSGRLAGYLLETAPLRTIYRNSRFLVVSEATRDEVATTHRVPSSAIDVVYPGVDHHYFGPAAKSSEPTLVFLGRLKAYKRIERLLDVVDALDGATLDIVGDGDHAENLKGLVRSKGLGARVNFHGHVDDETKRRLLARSWVAVTASSAEGWSSATLEAAAAGTPTVAHPVGGLNESIVHKQTGLHAESVADFISAVRSLVENKDLRTRLSVQARARAETLGWDRSARGTLEILQRAAHGNSAAATPGDVAGNKVASASHVED